MVIVSSILYFRTGWQLRLLNLSRILTPDSLCGCSVFFCTTFRLFLCRPAYAMLRSFSSFPFRRYSFSRLFFNFCFLGISFPVVSSVTLQLKCMKLSTETTQPSRPHSTHGYQCRCCLYARQLRHVLRVPLIICSMTLSSKYCLRIYTSASVASSATHSHLWFIFLLVCTFGDTA